MNEHSNKLYNYLINKIQNLNNPQILELGVNNGQSTLAFLNLIEKNGGHLYSIDFNDCSKVSNSKNWTFIQSRDDNFNFLNQKMPSKIDVILVDSCHEANHIEKIIYYYFNILNIGGYLFIDDISWLPYLKNQERNSFYCEINNKETFLKILEIYNSNKNLFELEFCFKSTGFALIKKKQTPLYYQQLKLKQEKFLLKIFLEEYS